MKPTNKLRLLAVLAVAIACSPAAVLAQTSAASSPVTTTSSTTMAADREEHHDYGWVGLLGLLGLAGLMPKKRDVHTHDTTTAGRSDVRR